MAVPTAHQRDAVRSDRRWMLAWIGGFMASVVFLVGVWAVYRVTGPHPRVRAVLRQLKHEARWLVPFLKRRPAKWYSLRDGTRHPLEPALDGGGHEPSRASGHAAQRA